MDNTCPVAQKDMSMNYSKQRSFSLLCGIYCLLIVIILTFMALYYFHIERQKEQFSRYFLRQLSHAGANISDALEGLRTNLANSVVTNQYYPETKNGFKEIKEENESSNSLVKTECHKDDAGELKKRKEYVEEQLKLIPALDFTSLGWKKGPPEILFLNKDKVKVDFELIWNKKGYAIKAQVKEIDLTECETQNEYVFFEINVDLKKLVVPLLPDDVFENFNGGIILAGKKNEVVFLETGMNLQLITLPDEKLKSDTKKDETDKNDVTDKKAEVNDSRFKPIRDVEIGLNQYKLFLSPFRWQISGDTGHESVGTPAGDEDMWIIGAIIPQLTFFSKAMTISPTLGFFIFCALCVGLLAIPFMRIRLIGLREGIKAHEVFILVIALLVGCSLVSLLTINLLTRKDEIKTIDHYLEIIAKDIGERFSKEFHSLEEELIHKVTSDKAEWERKGNILSGEDDSEYPFFELIVGMDSKGTQRWKWTVRNKTTPMLVLPNREYFEYAKKFDLDLFEKIERDEKIDSMKFFMEGRYVESIRSKNTGNSYAMLTLRRNMHLNRTSEMDIDIKIASSGDNRNFEDSIVFCIQAMPLCLIDPIMPPGFDFALIDQNGIVQFHSISSRNLQENFFEEATPRHDLEAVSKSNIPVHMDLEYRSNKIRAYITPFYGTPWTLVVFSDKSIPYQLEIETITFTVALYGAYLLILFLAFLIYLVFKPKPLPGEAFRMWLWPDIEKIEKYHIIILYIAITWTIWGVCFIFTPSIILVLMCFFLPLSVLVVLFRMLRNRDRKSVNEIRHICPLRLKITYIIVSSGLLIILAVLPPCGFYHAVYHEEIAVFIKYHQHEMAQSIKQRAQKIKEKYSKIELSDSNSKKLEKILLPVTDSLNDTEKILTDIYATGFNIKLDIKPIKEPQTRSIQRLITFLRDLPLVNSSDKLSIITRMFSGLKGDLKDDKSKAKWFVEDDKIVMIEQNNKQPILYSSSGEKEEVSFFHPHYLQIKTSTYRVKISPYWIVLCSILGLILLLLMIRAIMKLIFIIDINPPVSFEGKNLICNQDLKNQIHIRMQDICPLKFTGRRIITPSEIRETSSVKSLLTLCRNPAVNEIILDNFESDLDEPQIALKKLELLEGLAPMPNKQVILKSSIDPLFLLTSRCQDPSLNEDDKNNLLLRWGTVLQGYSKLRHQNEENEYHRHRNEFMVKELQQIDKYNYLPKNAKQSLVDEGWPNRLLKQYAKKLTELNEIKYYSVDNIVDQFKDLADAHYRKLWLSCSTDEKILLYRLAEQGFVNWHMKNAMRSLMKRRIIVMAPNFRLMNESFRQFVLNAEHPQSFQKWEEAAGISIWGRIRTPLIMVGIAMGAFFFITQREIFGQSLRILSAVAAGLPIILKAIGLLTQGKKIPLE